MEKEPLVSPFEHSQQDLPKRTLPPEAGMKIPAGLLDLLQGCQVEFQGMQEEKSPLDKDKVTERGTVVTTFMVLVD